MKRSRRRRGGEEERGNCGGEKRKGAEKSREDEKKRRKGGEKGEITSVERLKERLGSKETGWRERERRSEGRLYEMRRDGRSLEMYLFNSPKCHHSLHDVCRSVDESHS